MLYITWNCLNKIQWYIIVISYTILIYNHDTHDIILHVVGKFKLYQIQKHNLESEQFVHLYLVFQTIISRYAIVMLKNSINRQYLVTTKKLLNQNTKLWLQKQTCFMVLTEASTIRICLKEPDSASCRGKIM